MNCLKIMSRESISFSKAGQQLLLLLILFVLLTSCAPRVVSKVHKQEEALRVEEAVVVLDRHEEVYSGAALLGTLSVEDTGYTLDCSLRKVLEMAVKEARKMGGNIVRVVRYYPPDHSSSCYRLKAEVYRYLL